MLWQYAKQDTVKNFFPLPNEIFSLKLSPGALAIYSYLLFCEDTLRYTILPIQNAVDLYNQRQLRRLEEAVERMRVRKKLEGNEEHPA